MRYFVIHPDGYVQRHECSAAGLDGEPSREIVGGSLEFVSVIFEGKRCHMVVNEEGSIMNPPLPVNARATAIYWNATREGKTPVKYEPLSMPLIHGTAILYDGRLP